MELMDVIRNRRAVREYTNASIDRGTVERLIEAAILARSAMNLQPWARMISRRPGGSGALISFPPKFRSILNT